MSPACARARAEAAAFGADLVMFSELFFAGYPPEDLVLKPAFSKPAAPPARMLARDTADGGPALLVGLPWVENGLCYNAYALLDNGRIEAVRFKVDLPNYGVFDEKRVFSRRARCRGRWCSAASRIGVPICEDIWGPDPVECIAETGGEILLVPNGSPYWRGKTDERLPIAVARVVESGLPLIYLNQVGGQDELVFDGASFGLNADARSPSSCRPSRKWSPRPCGSAGPRALPASRRRARLIEEGDEADYAACVLGLRDYVDKNGFPGVVMGLSGGVDSALCAAIGGRRAGAWPRALPHAALSLHLEESLEDAAALRQGAWHSLRHPADRSGQSRASSPCSRRSLKGTQRAHHGREHPEPGARRDPDVGLQQIRHDAGDHRQQIGNVGRLRDASMAT